MREEGEGRPSPRAGATVVSAAQSAVGTRFRLHGRDVAHGLDCVGLVALALGSDAAPTGYRMRGGSRERWEALLAAHGLARGELPACGDVLLCRPGPAQFHLAIDAGDGVIHADAGLGRVVRRPGVPPWPVLSRWRFRGRFGEVS